MPRAMKAPIPLWRRMAAWSIRGLVLLAGPIWLFGWIAAFVAPMNTVKKCKTFAKRTGRLTYDR
jgi:hypothetical protein